MSGLRALRCWGSRLLLLGGLCLASPADATSVVTCLVSTSGVSFGSYDPTSATASTGAGNVGVSCGLVGAQTTVSYAIALSTGSGSFMGRTLVANTATLSYNLYTSASYSSVWGDGTSGSSTVSDSFTLTTAGASHNYPVFGKIPVGQVAPAGVYADTITVTLTY